MPYRFVFPTQARLCEQQANRTAPWASSSGSVVGSRAYCHSVHVSASAESTTAVAGGGAVALACYRHGAATGCSRSAMTSFKFARSRRYRGQPGATLACTNCCWAQFAPVSSAATMSEPPAWTRSSSELLSGRMVTCLWWSLGSRCRFIVLPYVERLPKRERNASALFRLRIRA